MHSKTHWKSILGRFSRCRILVVGDVMLDHYIMGRVSRISPEAPVPVVDVQQDEYFPGGASNVARNLRALGAKVSVLGVVGKDANGSILTLNLKKEGIDTSGLIGDVSRPTTLKTRVIANPHHHQVVRFDRESREALSPSLIRKALFQAGRMFRNVDAVIFEDYGKGFIEQDFLDALVDLAHRENVLTFADPNAHHHLDYRGLDGITPNRGEAFWMVRETTREPHDQPLSDVHLMRVGEKLLKETEVKNILVTLGEHGMCLFRENQKPHYIPTAAQEVYDVSGAGDTAISAFALGLASGLSGVDAAYISNQAAGIVVGKVGTATATRLELLEKL